MPAAMAQRQVQNGTLTVAFDVEHRVRAKRVCRLDKAGAGLGALGFEQDVQVAVRFEVVKLVGGLERFDPGDQRMRRVGHGHAVRHDRRVREELAAEQVHHQRCPAWRVP